MRPRLFVFLPSAISTLVLFGCTQRPMGGSMGGWGHMMGYGWYGGGVMWLILIVVAVVIIYFVLNLGKNGKILDDSTGESAMDILKKRYAKGEITKEDFDRLKKDIKE